MTDVFLIDSHNYPAVFKAFEIISHDCGRQAGHENYAVPNKYKNKISRINFRLSGLTKKQLESLCIGSDEEQQEILEMNELNEADKLLQEFFEEFI